MGRAGGEAGGLGSAIMVAAMGGGDGSDLKSITNSVRIAFLCLACCKIYDLSIGYFALNLLSELIFLLFS